MIQTELENQKITITNDDVSVIVFRCENSNIEILEKTSIDWVLDSVNKFKTQIVDFDENADEYIQIKNNLPTSKYTIVLYSFNPLLTSQNIDLCLDYLVLKEMKLIKLKYGYMFETEYFKQLPVVKEPAIFTGDGSEFLQIISNEDFSYATEVLQRRIVKYFMDNGVEFINPSNTVVNAYVQIENGATIFPFNNLYGATVVKSDAVLKEGNTIIDTVVGKESVVANSTIKNTDIKDHVVIFPYNTIDNCYIGSYSTIKSYNKISNTKIEENTEIESFNEIG